MTKIAKTAVEKDTETIEAIKTELQKDLEVEQKEQVMILSKLKQEHSQIKTKIQNWNLRCAEDNSITSIERNEVLSHLKKSK